MAKRDPKALGERIRRYRLDRGLTQTDVAKKLGLNQRTFSSYERGVLSPSPESLVRLSRVLEVSVDDLLGLERAKAPPEITLSQSRLWARLKRIEKLSRRSQKAVLDVLDAMIAKHERNGD